MANHARKKLATIQTELLRALTQKEIPPEGFDPVRIQATADTLVRKRARAVAKTWPALTQALGERFNEKFAAFAALTPIPNEGGALADGRAFALALAHNEELPDAGKLEALRVDLHYTTRKERLLPRRAFGFAGVLLKQPRRLVLAIWLPRFGERWFTVPLTINLYEKVLRN
jgi:hypothetical protein